MPNLNSSILQQVPLSMPSLDEQIRIASILSSLDDKIDLLNRENVTLEAMAETIFRQWFIEEAKEDWEEGTVSTFAEHYKESVNPQNLPTTAFYHYSIPAFDNGKRPTLELGEAIQSNKYVIPQDCILFSKLNPHKDKRIWLMLDDVPQDAICSTEFQIIKPKKIENLYFLYGWLNNNENYEEIASGVGGTSGSHQRIDPKFIFTFVCPYVDSVLIQKYNKVVKPIFYKQRENQKQIDSLTEQRDRLIPKLMTNNIQL
jgi:type I restriction enzyme S subunit